MDCLQRGYVYRSKLGLEDYFAEWHEEISTEVLYDSYSAFAQHARERHPLSREAFGKFMVYLRDSSPCRTEKTGTSANDA